MIKFFTGAHGSLRTVLWCIGLSVDVPEATGFGHVRCDPTRHPHTPDSSQFYT